MSSKYGLNGYDEAEDKYELDGHSPPPRPILKWPGGKWRLLNKIVPHLPTRIRRYHEPFIGGGALFFWLRRHGFRGPGYISDANEELIRTYRAVQQDPALVIAAFERHATRYSGANSENYYYSVSDCQPDDLADSEVGGRMLFLNRTGFNGLYRVNRAGKYNVAWGRGTAVSLDHGRILAAHAALQNTTITHGDFASVISAVGDGDLVYMDPPYPDGFSTYTAGGFDDKKQANLAQVCDVIDQMGANFIVSNKDCELIRDLYADYNVTTIMAPRSISRTGTGRTKAAEVLVTNTGSVSRADQDVPHWSVAPGNHDLDRSLSFDGEQVGRTGSSRRMELAPLPARHSVRPVAGQMTNHGHHGRTGGKDDFWGNEQSAANK